MLLKAMFSLHKIRNYNLQRTEKKVNRKRLYANYWVYYLYLVVTKLSVNC